MKFKVGQPVWAISISGKWEAGVITEALRTRTVVHRDVLETLAVYIADIGKPSRYVNGFAFMEKDLRPRDPDQFKVADESFEWRGVTA